jgi:hypothetical protein
MSKNGHISKLRCKNVTHFELLHKILFLAEEITSSGKKKHKNWLTFGREPSQKLYPYMNAKFEKTTFYTSVSHRNMLLT